ncbi:putative NADPH-quinone reductase [Volucribacter psittacicida]|uniref:Putative NADPH-quinone reductase n=1 Tax=Volucribacter psittacicida TaxID=203482 RepID=A0A4R1FYG7_9PAST|nr:NAD(P)H-dependent oxidoreductase [Volucribacter psittacicida]TCJ98902.1 putative NADPH-quinone reductase [Volucribacter psittacicida]
MKTLILLNHPNIEQSIVNKRLAQEVAKHPNDFTLHHLDQAYPDGNINIAAEQQLVEQHQAIVWQFPLYWFSTPPLLKQWQDQVLTYNWAYGRHAKGFKNKPLAIAISAGVSEHSYQTNGDYGHRLDQILLPIALTARYIHADYRTPFVFYGIDSTVGTDDTHLARLEQASQDYIHYLQQLTA